ncbi:MAG: hypothetical protein ACTHQQ_09430, partial [Solirubrobacteraceae bacterium]
MSDSDRQRNDAGKPSPTQPVAQPPKLPEVDSPPSEDVLEGVPSTEEIIEHAQAAEDIIKEQPSPDELLDRG